MNAQRACLVALVMTVCAAGVSRAQPYGGASPVPPGATPPSSLPAPGPESPPADAAVPAPTGPRLSDYLLGVKPDCCGPVGRNGPISFEPYVRSGPSIVLMNGFLAKTLETGWEVEGGGRSLFFNLEGTAAWTADIGISDIYNQGQHSDRVAHLNSIIAQEPNGIGGTTPTRVFGVPVTIKDLNRTYVNASLGREWYLWGSAANCAGCGNIGDGANWRVGMDLGGRWGTEKLDLHEITHRTEVIEGLFAAVHTDLEIPCGGWLIVVGGRIEWGNTWMHTILQDVPENLQNIDVLVTLGIRY